MLVLLLATTMQGATPRPLPVQRYRLEVKTANELDQTAVGKPAMRGGLTTTAFITVTMADTTGGQTSHIVVDSLTLAPTGAVVDQLKSFPNAARDAHGATVKIYVAKGKIQGPPTLSDSTNPALGAVVQSLGVMFPPVRREAKVGDSWADTNRISHSANGQRQGGEVVTEWKVAAMDGTALVIDAVLTSRTRTESSNGQVVVVTGGSKEHMVVPPNGPVRSASIETANTMTLTAPQAPAPLPGKITGSLTLTPIP